MGNFSEIGATVRHDVTFVVAPHWGDHRFQGRAVLPAVEAMQLLAHCCGRALPGTPVRHIAQAAFEKFLELPPAGHSVVAFCDLTALPDGGVQAVLLSTQTGATGIRRTKTHARVVFKPGPLSEPATALDLAAALAGPVFRVDPERVYDELVPFGPAFHTITQPVQLSQDGALAALKAADQPDVFTDMPLGSPLILDGAMHAACVWAQRFANIVAFPLGIDERLVLCPTCAGETYWARIFPVKTDGAGLVFDIWIIDVLGRLREWLKGVHMRDMSGGRLHPPEWIGSGRDADGLSALRPHCAALALIERDGLLPFSDGCLSADERQRVVKMGPRRRQGFMAVRLACKRLARDLSGDRTTPAGDLSTVRAQAGRPACPMPVGAPSYTCTAAHDRRFALAAADQQPVGVDVETVDARLLASLHLFASACEQARVNASPLGASQAATRVWSIKEAVAKALRVTLADAWQRTEVSVLGKTQSQVQIDAGHVVKAFHQTLDEHLVTLVVLRKDGAL
jgi:4'-phosphopantetheinyl transferase EntD